MARQNSRDLFICNSVYQILVAMWIKYKKCTMTESDLIISDHMNDGQLLAAKLKESGLFENVYYVVNQDFAKFRIKLKRFERIKMSIFPRQMLGKFVSLDMSYTQLYVANIDYFTQLLFNTLSRRNSNLKLNIYEDGFFTYSRLYEKDYKGTDIPITSISKKMLHRVLYRTRTIYGNVAKLFVFNPENMNWKPEFLVEELDKINSDDNQFKELCNKVFSYYDSSDVYDCQYIFLEESFYAEGAKLNDLEVLEQFAERVGRENIMVKIHPRNPENRFAKLGYKTNANTSIPWEVLIMNTEDLTEKVLITVSSSSILNPMLIFGKKIRAYSIYECVDHENCKSRLLSGEMWEMAYKMFKKYDDIVTICNSIDEIESV